MFLWQLLIPERAREYMDDIKAARNYGGEGMEGHKAKIVFGSLDVRQKPQWLYRRGQRL